MMKTCNWLIGTMLIAWLGLAQAAEPPAPQQIIQHTVDKTIAELAKRRADITAEPGLLYPLIQHTVVPAFDFERITRSAMGPFWRKATSAQREQLVQAFQALLVRSYAQTLLLYPDPNIAYLPVRFSKDQQKMLAPTQVIDTQGQAIPINYRLHRHPERGWLVYDVVVEGISLITNYRSTFKSLIRQGANQAKDRSARIERGIEHLIRELQTKNAAAS
ncbi:MAG: ABC transporter substrate-binding protein [Pseudomonadota bacterium]